MQKYRERLGVLFAWVEGRTDETVAFWWQKPDGSDITDLTYLPADEFDAAFVPVLETTADLSGGI